MAESVVGYQQVLPEVPGRLPWRRPTEHLVKDETESTGWRVASGRRRSDRLLVPAIREAVDAWRAARYPGASAVARRLFDYWFEEEHEIDGFETPFRYHFCQREAIETLVWLVEVEGAKDAEALITAWGRAPSGMLPSQMAFRHPVGAARQVRLPGGQWQDLPPEGLGRFAFGMATGAGKTWVMAMVVAWAYLHRRLEADSGLASNFLIVAPNVIVYERLREDFGANRVFRRLPLIPPEWKADFDLRVVLAREGEAIRTHGNLILTNVQRLYRRRDGARTNENPVTAILGPVPPKDIGTVQERALEERLGSLDDLIVVNDEAHHVHDEGLEWSRSLLRLHDTLPSGLSLWLDFSATPRDSAKRFFAWTVCDYPLAQAVEDRIVKAPVIVRRSGDRDAPADDSEDVARGSAVYRYGFLVRAAVERWREHTMAFGKLGIRPVLFVTAENNADADAIGAYLDSTPEFGIQPHAVLVIHTDNSGEVRKKHLERARRAARQIDRPDSGIQVIVSVMMLREGWDVRNVSVVLGLRPFTAKSEILPEQVVGRGLRLMRGIGPERTQTLEVLGTRQLLETLRGQLETEGVGVATVPEGGPMAELVMPLEERRQYDIAFPRFGASLRREVAKLEDLDVRTLEPIYAGDALSEPERIRLQMDFAITETTVSQEEIEDVRPSREVLAQIARRIGEESRLAGVGLFAHLYPLVRDYVKTRCFGQEVDVEDRRVLGALTRVGIREGVVRYLAREIGSVVSVRRRDEFEAGERRLSETHPFHWRRNLPLFRAKKTVFNQVATYNDFEKRFAEFLERAEDIQRFSALAATEQGSAGVLFRVDYLKASGAIGFYYPDWIAVQETKDGEVHWILETKGYVWEGTELKDAAMRRWCGRAREATGVRWRYRRVDQVDFEAFCEANRTLGGLLGDIMVRHMDAERAARPPMSAEEVRRARDEGRA